MKLWIPILIAGLAVAGCFKSAPSTEPSSQPAGAKYTCPMHPQIRADKPGDCPICHMALVPIEHPQSPVPVKKTMYRSTMNPTEVSSHPGKDSMGMEMVAFETTETSSTDSIRVGPAARQTIGLKLGAVETRHLHREIRAAAHIVPDETKLYHVNVKVNGWVEKLFIATTGEYVQKGDPLLTLYSPELLTAQAEHLSASPEVRPTARRRLELLDMTDAQIAELERTKQINKSLTLLAPANGYVAERNIAAGHKVMAGEQVLALADYSAVWADAAIFQDDIAGVTTGATVAVTVGRDTFTGKVSFIAPTVDADTRTVKVRMQIPNPDGKLKPEMWATARLRIDLGEKLAIPAAAVMRTGEQTYAFKDAGDGKLTPVAVRLGSRAGEWFELLDGLAAGDQVVTSANFLIDSEAQVKGALAGMGHGH
jgi:multidrug efflux pump subunit AcrA (membrane-fusion protein)